MISMVRISLNQSFASMQIHLRSSEFGFSLWWTSLADCVVSRHACQQTSSIFWVCGFFDGSFADCLTQYVYNNILILQYFARASRRNYFRISYLVLELYQSELFLGLQQANQHRLARISTCLLIAVWSHYLNLLNLMTHFHQNDSREPYKRVFGSFLPPWRLE
jgi:hypothetical protein